MQASRKGCGENGKIHGGYSDCLDSESRGGRDETAGEGDSGAEAGGLRTESDSEGNKRDVRPTGTLDFHDRNIKKAGRGQGASQKHDPGGDNQDSPNAQWEAEGAGVIPQLVYHPAAGKDRVRRSIE